MFKLNISWEDAVFLVEVIHVVSYTLEVKNKKYTISFNDKSVLNCVKEMLEERREEE